MLAAIHQELSRIEGEEELKSSLLVKVAVVPGAFPLKIVITMCVLFIVIRWIGISTLRDSAM